MALRDLNLCQYLALYGVKKEASKYLLSWYVVLPISSIFSVFLNIFAFKVLDTCFFSVK